MRNTSDLRSSAPCISELRSALRESDLPILVDVVDWAEVSEGFIDEIEKEVVVAMRGVDSGYKPIKYLKSHMQGVGTRDVV